MIQKILEKFKTKKGREIQIVEPQLELADSLLLFINKLVAEDTYLSLTGKPKTLEEEKSWILKNIEANQKEISFAIFALFEDKVVGECDITRGGTRDWHVGKIGLMIDRDFRQEGIGQKILEFILEKARRMKIEIAALDCFSDNIPAINLYKKMGFQEYALLPKGLKRKNKYSDAIKMYKNINDQ